MADICRDWGLALRRVHRRRRLARPARRRRPAGAPLWARFYELGTNRPVFTGRDKVIPDVFSEIEQERRSGHAYYGTWPARPLGTDYPGWLAGLKGR